MKNEIKIYWHAGKITRKDRASLNGHRGVTIWLTGLSASGKSTIANKLEEKLYERGCRAVVVLDGDNVRHGLNKDLGFSREDREENIRRISELAKILTMSGIINIIAFISPYKKDRDKARAIQGDGDFIEVYVNCPLEVCERRDPKGLYKKARKDEIKEFTGVSDLYQQPENPEIVLDTWNNDAGTCVEKIVKYLVDQEIIIDLSRDERFLPDLCNNS